MQIIRSSKKVYDTSKNVTFTGMGFKTFSYKFHESKQYAKNVNIFNAQILIQNILHKNTDNMFALWPLLLTWFNFNPSMDK